MSPIRTTLLTLTIACCAAGSAVAQAGEPASATAAYRLSMDAQGELEALRLEMGRAMVGSLDVNASNAGPRDTYYAALTFADKVDELVFDQLRELSPKRETLQRKVEVGDVAIVLQSAVARLRQVKRHLGITSESSRTPDAGVFSLTDVFDALVHANRQINELLDRRWSPAQVFQRVTLAVSYSAELLQRWPGVRALPPTPAFERQKQPADVYMRLLQCFVLTRAVLQRAGLSSVDLRVGELRPESVRPSDVYDIASLIVSQLATLHRTTTDAALKHPAYPPGRRLPSHVYQRTGILEAQLTALVAQVERDPSRLKR